MKEVEDDNFAIQMEINDSLINEEVKRMQEQLLQMGFDLVMINKVIRLFNVKTIEEAILLLIKADDGFWGHPFVSESLEEEGEMRRSFYRAAVTIVRNRANAELCEICGELRSMHNEDLRYNSKLLFDHSSKMKNESECDICMGAIEDPIAIQPCQHKFCRTCLVEYLKDKVDVNKIEMIKCPSSDCDTILDESFLLEVLPPEHKTKYSAFKEKNKLLKKSNIVFCPSCDSYAECLQKEKCELKCANNHSFCNCGRVKHDDPCFKAGDELKLKEYIKDEKIKKCPKCGFLIKKDKGCNHITCGNPSCRFEFCWLCLKEYRGDHFEMGQCKGLQFVDEDSLFYKFRAFPCLIQACHCLMIVLSLFGLLIFFILVVAFPFIPFIAIAFHFIFQERLFITQVNCLTGAKLIAVSIMYWLSLIFIAIATLPGYYLLLGIAIASSVLFAIVKLTLSLIHCAQYLCQNQRDDLVLLNEENIEGVN